MGDVVQFVPMLDETRLMAAIRETTGSDTTAVVIIAATADTISVRAFGSDSASAVNAAARALADAQHPKCD